MDYSKPVFFLLLYPCYYFNVHFHNVDVLLRIVILLLLTTDMFVSCVKFLVCFHHHLHHSWQNVMTCQFTLENEVVNLKSGRKQTFVQCPSCNETFKGHNCYMPGVIVTKRESEFHADLWTLWKGLHNCESLALFMSLTLIQMSWPMSWEGPSPSWSPCEL